MLALAADPSILWRENVTEPSRDHHLGADYGLSSDETNSPFQSVATTRGSTSRAGSFRLKSHTVSEVTILFIDIKGFTSELGNLSPASIGEWVTALYDRVDIAAAAHGVCKVEVRGDCCICAAGAEGAVSLPSSPPPHADRALDQATRMLAFAAALHADLASLRACAPGAPPGLCMGMATGEAAFLLSESGVEGFASAQGDTVNLAARMQATAALGAVRVHQSTADRWAAETRRPVPATVPVECKGRGQQRAAVFDCAVARFRNAAALAAAPASAAPATAFLRRRASGPV
jgi:class 3 adenylate cyclase